MYSRLWFLETSESDIEMKTLPGNIVAYKKTPEFDECCIPRGLLKSHQTKESVYDE